MMTNLMVYFRLQSDNSKTGPIPVSTSGKQSCPPACRLRDNGCYAENFPMSIHWDKVTRGEKGYEWPAFLERIRKLKPNQIWRHNQAGDLPGMGNVIDWGSMTDLIRANTGRRGFTYTHYPMTTHNKGLVRVANENGFTINLSADSPTEADELLALGVGPVVTLLPRGDVPRLTPAGNKITVCPAQTVEYMTCAVCQLCQNPKREAIVGFIVHGARFKVAQRVIEIKQEK